MKRSIQHLLVLRRKQKHEFYYLKIAIYNQNSFYEFFFFSLVTINCHTIGKLHYEIINEIV